MKSDVSRRMPFAGDIVFWLASFLLPVAIMLAVMGWNGIYPFGAESFLTGDLKYQYIDFYNWLQSVIEGNGTLFYTASPSLGNNAWGLFSYYLSSPLNLLIIFFDETNLTDFMIVITALKLGGAGIAMSFYLRRRFELNRSFALALSLAYVWSLWSITQLRNPAWMDILILLPLMLYGMYCFVNEGTWKLLIISLTLSVVICWYTAYMAILFSCLFVFYELYIWRLGGNHSNRDTFSIIIRYFGLVLLSLLLSAFTFLPTIVAMMGGSAPPELNHILNFDVSVLLSSLFFGNWEPDLVPQNFFTTCVLVLVVLFFFMRDIPGRLRLITAAFAVLMLISTWLAPLEFLWGGLRIPHGFFCRFTFLTAFLFIFIAAFALSRIQNRKTSLKEVLMGSGALLATASLCMVAGGFIRLRYYLITVAAMLIITAAIIGHLRGRPGSVSSRYLLSSALIIGICAESVYYCHIAWDDIYRGYTQEHHDTYRQNEKKQLDELRAYDDSTYRIDKTYTRAHYAALNEGLALNYMHLSSYSSASNASATGFLNALGYSQEGEVSVRYATPIITSDSLLSVKYVSTGSLPAGFKDTPLTPTSDGQSFYENPYALSLGYLASDRIISASLDEYGNPFDRQNALISAILGEDVLCFSQMDARLTADAKGQKEWLVEIPGNSIGYTYIIADEISGCWLTVDDGDPVMDNWRFKHSIQELGQPETGATSHTVKLTSLSPESDQYRSGDIPELPQNATCLFYYVDLDVLKEAIDTLAAHQFEPTVFKDGYLQGTMHVEEDSYLLLTMPNVAGWTVRINDAAITPQEAYDGALMVLPLTAGDNEITMEFVSPGFFIGCLVSLSVLAVLCASRIISARRRASMR